MEVNYLFSSASKTINVKVSKNQTLGEVLDDLISKNEDLKNLSINFILAHGCSLDKNKTFENQNIKDKEVITIMCNENDSEEEEDSNPINFKYKKVLIKKAHVNLENSNINAFIDKTFDVFKSLNNQYLLICSYSDNYKDYALLAVEITKEKLLFSKKNAHSERIFTCSHHLDEYNKRDLLITGSFDRTIKIWNINNGFELLYKKRPDYEFKENTYLLSESLLACNNNIYLIVSAYELYSEGYNILMYNLKNLDKFGILKDSKDNTNYLEIYYELKIPLIIAANCGNIKIFDFKRNRLIKTFSDNNNKINFLSTVIQLYRDKICLISSSSDGFLRIWDYNNPSVLVYKIQSYLNNWLIGLKLIENNKYLLAGCADGSIKEFDLLHDCVACTFPRNVDHDPVFTLRYIQIEGKNYLFSHSHKGLIELWN